MKKLFLFLLIISTTCNAQEVSAIYPDFKDTTEWKNYILNNFNNLKSVWQYESGKYVYGIFTKGANIYICNYSFDPRLKQIGDKFLNSIDFIDPDTGKEALLISDSKTDMNLCSKSVLLHPNGDYQVYTYYLGTEYRFSEKKYKSIRVILDKPNISIDINLNKAIVEKTSKL